jgi:hypothetical protein
MVMRMLWAALAWRRAANRQAIACSPALGDEAACGFNHTGALVVRLLRLEPAMNLVILAGIVSHV